MASPADAEERQGTPSEAETSPGYPPAAIYPRLTAAFNAGRTRAILSSGQACVLYRLSLASKDGAWVIVEEEEALQHLLGVLEAQGARYRLGAPLGVEWLAGGWSSHLELAREGLRIRADFVSRPPRIRRERLAQLWQAVQGQTVPVLPIPELIAIKQTLRERDYPIIGALALRLTEPAAILRWSIAPGSLVAAMEQHPELARRVAQERPVLARIAQDPSCVREALLQERLASMDADRQRIERYRVALAPWATRWQTLAPQLQGLPLRAAHRRLVEEARGVLPTVVAEHPR